MIVMDLSVTSPPPHRGDGRAAHVAIVVAIASTAMLLSRWLCDVSCLLGLLHGLKAGVRIAPGLVALVCRPRQASAFLRTCFAQGPPTMTTPGLAQFAEFRVAAQVCCGGRSRKLTPSVAISLVARCLLQLPSPRFDKDCFPAPLSRAFGGIWNETNFLAHQNNAVSVSKQVEQAEKLDPQGHRAQLEEFTEVWWGASRGGALAQPQRHVCHRRCRLVFLPIHDPGQGHRGGASPWCPGATWLHAGPGGGSSCICLENET